jgi:hypothetical protein
MHVRRAFSSARQISPEQDKLSIASNKVLAAIRAAPSQSVLLPLPYNSSKPLRHLSDIDYLAPQCSRLSGLLRASDLQYIFSSPGERKVATSFDGTADCVGDDAMALIDALKAQMHQRVKAIVPEHTVESGCIVSWLSPQNSEKSRASTSNLKEHSYSYTDWHVDKANNFEYDITALLYLSAHNVDFGGGELNFSNPNGPWTTVQPQPGRFVVFDSSIDNPHCVNEVTWGDRLLLSVWYTRTQDKTKL